MLERWAELDDLADRYRLPRTELPSAALAAGMFDWAKGASLEKVLEESNIGAGDFVRWAKQTIDLLDQVAQACEDAVSHPGLTADAERLGELAQTARTAKRAVRRGIVEASSSS